MVEEEQSGGPVDGARVGGHGGRENSPVLYRQGRVAGLVKCLSEDHQSRRVEPDAQRGIGPGPG